MSEDAPDIFNCSICLEHFKKPKVLPCQHTFCENCLDTYIQSSTGGGDETLSPEWFLCPLCRQTVKPPDVNSKPREWASLMPINVMISSLKQTSEAGATVEGSNESRNCGPCQRDEEISTGSFWCPNCLEFLCENCKKFHKRMKTLEMHKIIPVEEFDKEHTGSWHTNMAEIDEPCPDHVGESLKVFCLGHKTMCCVMCLTTHHNECTEIKSLEEMAEQMEGDQTGAKFIDSLDDMKTRLGETIEDKQENKKHLNERRKHLIDEVKLIVEQAKSNLDAFLEDFENKLTILNEQQNETVSKTEQKIECLLKTLEYGEQMLKYLSRNCPPKQVFIAIEKFKVQILNHLQQLEMDSDNDERVDYQIILGEILQKLKNPKPELELAQVELKYEISKKPIMPIITELSLVSDQENEMQRKRQFLKADVSKFEAVKLWDVKGNGLIGSGVFLHSEILVCCDSKNQTLNAYDSKGMFLCDLKLEYHPLVMDLAFDKEIVVLGYQREKICTYNFNRKQFEELQEIKIPYQAKGMTIIGNRIVITDGQNIDIMTVFGSKLQSITVEDFSAKDFCFIAADKSSIYYHVQGTFMEISVNGNDVAKKSIELPRKLGKRYNNGIAIDQYGNRYICAGNNLCILSKDGQNHCLFNTNIPTFAVGLQKNGSCFFVSNSKSNEENIMLEVYEIHVQ